MDWGRKPVGRTEEKGKTPRIGFRGGNALGTAFRMLQARWRRVPADGVLGNSDSVRGQYRESRGLSDGQGRCSLERGALRWKTREDRRHLRVPGEAVAVTLLCPLNPVLGVSLQPSWAQHTPDFVIWAHSTAWQRNRVSAQGVLLGGWGAWGWEPGRRLSVAPLPSSSPARHHVTQTNQ